MASTLQEVLAPTGSFSGSATPAGAHPKCVLLIEDDEASMVLVRHALETYGKGMYRLEWCKSLDAGLARLREKDIDLVVLDLGLPETTGHASCCWVRATAPTVPILKLTGDDREDTEEDAALSGVEGYLVKHRTPGLLLLKAIRAAIS